MVEQHLNANLGLISGNIQGENPSEKHYNASDCMSICIILLYVATYIYLHSKWYICICS